MCSCVLQVWQSAPRIAIEGHGCNYIWINLRELMFSLRHTVLLGLALSAGPPVITLPLPHRLPSRACYTRRCSGVRSFCTAERSGEPERGQRSAAMADDGDAPPHGSAADLVPNGAIPNGSAAPEYDATSGATSSAAGAHSCSHISCTPSGSFRMCSVWNPCPACWHTLKVRGHASMCKCGLKGSGSMLSD